MWVSDLTNVYWTSLFILTITATHTYNTDVSSSKVICASLISVEGLGSSFLEAGLVESKLTLLSSDTN